MPRHVTFGQQPTTAPPGHFKEIIFPQLARLDSGTKEGWISRVLNSQGGGARELPRSLSFQDRDLGGHDGAFSAGTLWEVTLDEESGLMSGKGWLASDDEGRKAAFAVWSKKIQHNSIDLADIPPGGVRLVDHGDFWDDDFWMEVIFDEWNVGKTTIVQMPAHANARGVVDNLDEIMASFLADDAPLICDVPSMIHGHQAVEIVAGATALPKWEYFARPEADKKVKFVIGVPDENGWIPCYGHLAMWDEPHTGYDGQDVYVPRPLHGYPEWNQAGPLTDRGQVETGPMVLYGGHVSLQEAADDPLNAFADVHVIPGRFGPWCSGVIRPRVAANEHALYDARASRISGHWKGGKLRMIVGVNNEGFNVGGTGNPLEAREPDELVASYDPQGGQTTFTNSMPTELLHFGELSTDALDKLRQWRAAGAPGALTMSADAAGQIMTLDITVPNEDGDAVVFDIDIERAKRERTLALELEAENS